MTASLENPIAGNDAARRESEAPVAVENWENEGGHFPNLRSAAITPSDVSPRVRGEAMDSEGLAAMRAKFLADFANGSMGRDHNTYRHRVRVLDRLTEPTLIRAVGGQK